MSTEAPVKLTHNEEIKERDSDARGHHRGHAGRPERRHIFAATTSQFLKFHGVYPAGRPRFALKTGRKYIMMVRSRIPGGVMTANQWRVFDELVVALRQQHAADHHPPDHPVSRHRQGEPARWWSRRSTNRLLSTLAACGDVNRNVLAPPTPAYTRARDQVYRRLPAGGGCAQAADPRLLRHLD